MDQIFFIFILIVVATIFFLVFYFSKNAIIKRKLKKSELKKIATIKDGEIVRIVGNVEFIDPPLFAPLSKRKCSYYHVLIEQKVSSGKNSKWKTIIEEEVSNRFLIKDDSKFAFINDSKIRSYIVTDQSYSSGFFKDATDNLETYLKSKGYKSEGLLGINKTLRYKEGILEEGERIAVLGKAEWKDVAVLNLPKKYERILEITSSEEDPIYLSDDPTTAEANTANPHSSVKESSPKRRYRK
ncbi:hypothetical protein BZG02_13825 [Labilibaculum filiforme]|uniref:RING-type E3 ubiquitin transferase n=1 Tax=Labilibaculum filiforme TaxID=1940526 RepID=A0A2N3HVC8_9BACT|nr:hypothetical protein [Labilibaculum filiforme]PKQ62014.1 hypothetical protein BZG02_13825 [Labilibaculum filiforme]